MPLTPDQIRALQPSELPLVASELIGDNAQGIADNAAAIPTNITDLADVPPLGASGTVLTVDGAGTGLEWAAPAGGGFAWPPDDWAASGDAGVGTGATFGAPVDLSTLDAGTALASSGREVSDTVLWAIPPTNTATLSGLKLANTPAGDFGAVVRLSVESVGVYSNATFAYTAALGMHVGADLSGAMVWAGIARTSNVGAGHTWYLSDSAAGRAAFTARITGSGAQRTSDGADILLVREGTNFKSWIRSGPDGSWSYVGTYTTNVNYIGAGVLSLLTRSQAAGADIKVRVRVLRAPDATIADPSDL